MKRRACCLLVWLRWQQFRDGSSTGSAISITIVAPGKVRTRFRWLQTLGQDRHDVTAKMCRISLSACSEGLDPAHPEASGGRSWCFRSDGVLMVDTRTGSGEKTLKTIRSFTDAPIKVVVTRIFMATIPAQCVFRQARRDDLRGRKICAVNAAAPARAQRQRPGPDLAAVRWRPIANPPRRAAAVTFIDGETVDSSQ